MSTVSQTSPATGGGFRQRFLLAMSAVALIVVLTVGRFWRGIVDVAAHAHPHAPAWAEVMGWPAAVRVHVAAALCALALGAVLMTVRKGRAFHRLAGWGWVGLVSVVAGSSLFITQLNHGRLSLLHLITGWTLIALPLAVMFARRHAVARHRRMMMGLFYGGFAINAVVAFIPGRAMWNLVFG